MDFGPNVYEPYSPKAIVTNSQLTPAHQTDHL